MWFRHSSSPTQLHRFRCRLRARRLGGKHFDEFAQFVLDIRDEPNLLVDPANPMRCPSVLRNASVISVVIPALPRFGHPLERTVSLVSAVWISVDTMSASDWPWTDAVLSDTDPSKTHHYRVEALPAPNDNLEASRKASAETRAPASVVGSSGSGRPVAG